MIRSLGRFKMLTPRRQGSKGRKEEKTEKHTLLCAFAPLRLGVSLINL
jgi:hypothetical protein